MDQEQRILASWHDNASPWARLIERGALASRQISNPAIEKAILRYQPQRIVDVGCGEGWLCRRLSSHHIDTTGIDAIPALITRAREQHPHGNYHCLSFHDIASLSCPPFDLAVCNFSLFGDQSVVRLLADLSPLLQPEGTLLIQTLHPLMACDGDYREGWRETHWQGFEEDFGQALPWYFRPLENWLRLLHRQGYRVQLEEPLDPHSHLPVSVIFHARRLP